MTSDYRHFCCCCGGTDNGPTYRNPYGKDDICRACLRNAPCPNGCAGEMQLDADIPAMICLTCKTTMDIKKGDS